MEKVALHLMEDEFYSSYFLTLANLHLYNNPYRDDMLLSVPAFVESKYCHIVLLLLILYIHLFEVTSYSK